MVFVIDFILKFFIIIIKVFLLFLFFGQKRRVCRLLDKLLFISIKKIFIKKLLIDMMFIFFYFDFVEIVFNICIVVMYMYVQGKIYMVVENVMQMYRLLIFIILWFYFLYDDQGMVFGIIFVVLYFLMKVSYCSFSLI